MIAKFYNKFDELHEQSVTQALSKGPDMIQLKNQVKYRIPERWTKRFHKFDIVDIGIFRDKPGILQERGRVNKEAKVEEVHRNKKQAQLSIKMQQNEQLSKLQQDATQPLSNQYLKTSISHSQLEN